MVSESLSEPRLLSLSGFSEWPPARPELKPVSSAKSLQLAQAAFFALGLWQTSCGEKSCEGMHRAVHTSSCKARKYLVILQKRFWLRRRSASCLRALQQSLLPTTRSGLLSADQTKFPIWKDGSTYQGHSVAGSPVWVEGALPCYVRLNSRRCCWPE